MNQSINGMNEINERTRSTRRQQTSARAAQNPKAIVVIIYGVERKVLTIIAPIPQW